MPPRFLARQLACPTGLLGRVVGSWMNRHHAKRNAFVVRQLAVSSSDRILEIGFGGGFNLPFLIADAAFVAGVELSHEMVKQAKKQFANAVSAGRADFRWGNAEKLP